MALHSDTKNYYRILGLTVGASSDDVKRAYRSLAKELHPARHPNAADATARFQALNEAHAVLSDPEARARYDAACIAAEPANQPRHSIDAVTCSSCGAVTAQPRYVIFWYVIGLIFATTRRTIQGVFCPSCAPKKAAQASAITWLLGWWGIPWGPILTIGALYRNLLNGTQPADANGEILGRQALYFWENGKPDLAAATLDQGLRLKIDATLRERLSELRQALPPASKARLINRWALLRGWGFWAQVAPILAAMAFITWSNRNSVITTIARQELAHAGEFRSTVISEPDPAVQVLATIRPFQNFRILAGWGSGGYERIITDNGTVGFMQKASIISGDGMTDLRGRCFPFGPVYLTNGYVFRQTGFGPHTLKTTNGLPSDAVVKLRDIAGRTVLSFYVTAGGVATIDSVPEGTFTIEFATGREFSPSCGYFLTGMSSRRFVKSNTFEMQFEGNYRYTSIMEITLNPVVGGTAQTVASDDMTFDRD